MKNHYECDDYYLIENKLIFKYTFNKPLSDYYDIIKKKNIESIYFSNYNNYQSCIDNFNEHTNISERNYTKSVFNKDIVNLPYGVVNLFLGHSFKSKLVNLPSSIKIINCENNFCGDVNDLPNSISCLILGMGFNKCLYNLPEKINCLCLSGYNYFDIKLINLKLLRHLILDGKYKFNSHCLPRELISLVLKGFVVYNISNLPSSLEYLIFKSKCYFTSVKNTANIPNKLRFLCMTSNLNVCYLPSSIKTYFCQIYENDKKRTICYKKDNLPNSIKNLIVYDQNKYSKQKNYNFKIKFFNKTIIEQFGELEYHYRKSHFL